MGTLRKMGAFLGLVPDESREYDEHDYRDEDVDGGSTYRADYRSDSYASDDLSGYQDGDYAADEVGRVGYAADAQHDAEYGTTEYAGAGYGSGGYGGAGYADAEYGDREYASVGAAGDTYGDDAYGEASYADADDQPSRDHAHAGAAPASRPSATRGSSGRGSAGDDFQTQGALAVQPRFEAVAETGGSAKPVTVKLEGFADARQVGEAYRDGVAVILDMTDLTDAEARRMVDFAAGLAFAVRGSIDKVTTKVFMLHPPTADADH